MNLFRSALSACVVEGLIHTKKYLYSNDTTLKPSPLNKLAIPLKSANHTNHGTTSTPLSVRLPPMTLAGLNQSLRNFTNGRL